MKYTPVAKHVEFAEDGQAINIEFALARKWGQNFRGITALSKCRDFLGDALFAEATKCRTTIYRFSYDGTGKARIPKTYSCFAMRFLDKETQDKFLDNVHTHSHIISELSGTEPTEVHVDGLYTVIVADKAWSVNNFGVSLFTFLLKGMVLQKDPTKSFYQNIYDSTYEAVQWDGKITHHSTNEAGYLRSISEESMNLAIKNIHAVNKCPTTFGGKTYKNVTFDNDIHHRSGWVHTLTYKDNEFWKLLENCK